jgi:hypothetical protein
LSEHLVISPKVIAQHHNLKVDIVVFEFGRGDRIQALTLGFPDQLFSIGPFVVLSDNLVGITPQVGTENPVVVLIPFKEFPLEGLSRSNALFLGNPKSHKPAWKFPPDRLIHTAIVLDWVASSGLVPAFRIKRRLSSLVGNDESEVGSSGCKNT